MNPVRRGELFGSVGAGGRKVAVGRRSLKVSGGEQLHSADLGREHK